MKDRFNVNDESELLMVQQITDLLPKEFEDRIRVCSFVFACVGVQARQSDDFLVENLREHLKLARSIQKHGEH